VAKPPSTPTVTTATPLSEYRATIRYLAALHDLLDWCPPHKVPRREQIKGLVLKLSGSLLRLDSPVTSELATLIE
jgi:hypothetical protein